MISSVDRKRERDGGEGVCGNWSSRLASCVTSPDSGNDPIDAFDRHPLSVHNTLQRRFTKKEVGAYVDDDEGELHICREGEEEWKPIREGRTVTGDIKTTIW